MAKTDKKMTGKEMAKKIIDLKIELLKNPTKRKSIKREIARLLTMANADGRKLMVESRKTERAATGKTKNKSTEEAK
jgi:ribosomal protein L29